MSVEEQIRGIEMDSFKIGRILGVLHGISMRSDVPKEVRKKCEEVYKEYFDIISVEQKCENPSLDNKIKICKYDNGACNWEEDCCCNCARYPMETKPRKRLSQDQIEKLIEMIKES